MNKQEIHVPANMQKKEEKPKLSKLNTNAIKAFVHDLSPEEMALLLSLLDSGVLFAELERRTSKMKFQIDLIKGVIA